MTVRPIMLALLEFVPLGMGMSTAAARSFRLTNGNSVPIGRES